MGPLVVPKMESSVTVSDLVQVQGWIPPLKTGISSFGIKLETSKFGNTTTSYLLVRRTTPLCWPA
jgi:hypothetical protein